MARIVLAGYLVRNPLGGYTWQAAHYLLGLRALGHDVWFYEDTGHFSLAYNPLTNHYGPRYEYARGYRDGYEDGYRQGYASSRYGYYYGRDRARYRYDDRYYRDDRTRDRDGYYDRDGRWHPYDGDVIYEEPRRRW